MSSNFYDLCLAFVCQEGKLESKSCILAASIRYHYGHSIELVAALPSPSDVWGEPAPETINYLKSLNVRIESVSNPIGVNYPIGNKLLCLDIPTSRSRIAFVDTDIICLNFADPSELINRREVLFVPATANHATHEEWETIYNSLHINSPIKIYRTLVSQKLGYPYANTGLVIANSKEGVGKLWADMVGAVQGNDSISDSLKYPYSDQVALPLVIIKNKLKFMFIDTKWNYPGWLWKTPKKSLPVFYHYQRADVLAKDQNAYRFLLLLIKEDTKLKKIVMKSNEFSCVIRNSVLRLAKLAMSNLLSRAGGLPR